MGSRLGSYTLTGNTKTVNSTDNVNYLSVGCLSGTVVVTLTGKTIESWGDNTPINLSTGQAISIQDTINIQPLDGAEIDTTSGTAAVIVG